MGKGQVLARVHPVILCGGAGTRLWPASREALPKQFAPLLGAHSTFQETLLRVQASALFTRPLIVTNARHVDLAQAQADALGIAVDFLLEPMARDSGPAMLAAALWLERFAQGELGLMLAADHLVRKPEAFRQAVEAGRQAAQAGAIVTFGITPTSPATGYGYIEPGAALVGGAHQVARFIEKPPREQALAYLAQGFVWNSGNFLFSPTVLIAEYTGRQPACVVAVQAALAQAQAVSCGLLLDEAAFSGAQKRSFDYAVMEHTRHAAVIAGDFGWSDIGGWDALWAIADKDANGNVVQGDVLAQDCHDTYIATTGLLVAALGVHDLVIVAMPDAVLVIDKARAGEVKALVEQLKQAGRADLLRNPP